MNAAPAAAPMPHVMNTYGRLPIALSHGDGCWVWDVNGKRYLDGLGGIAVNTLGHHHPKLACSSKLILDQGCWSVHPRHSIPDH